VQLLCFDSWLPPAVADYVCSFPARQPLRHESGKENKNEVPASDRDSIRLIDHPPGAATTWPHKLPARLWNHFHRMCPTGSDHRRDIRPLQALGGGMDVDCDIHPTVGCVGI